MKINESTLISYATSPEVCPDKEGWLWKRGDVNRAFQRRYFVLKGNVLFYFEKPSDKEPIGFIILEGCTVELAEQETDKFAFNLNFHGEGCREYVLGADDPDSQEEWMKLLAAASYDYIKLMVIELEQKLKELDELDHVQPPVLLGHSPALHFAAQQAAKAHPSAGRTNPFNKVDPPHVSQAWSASASAADWSEIHAAYGKKVCSDRQQWCRQAGFIQCSTD